MNSMSGFYNAPVSKALCLVSMGLTTFAVLSGGNEEIHATLPCFENPPPPFPPVLLPLQTTGDDDSEILLSDVRTDHAPRTAPCLQTTAARIATCIWTRLSTTATTC